MERENRQNIRSASNKFNAHDLRGHYLFGAWAFGDASLSICSSPRILLNKPKTTINMAIIDVVKNEIIDGEFCHKFSSEDLRIGTQLIVYPAQTAFFVKGGAICDEFLSGTYTIKTENIPILNKIINLPFGNNTPFAAEVWFVSQVSKLDMQWGTPQPILLEDPRYKIIVPVRAYGQYGIHIDKPRLFLETLIGNMKSFTADKIEQYFKGRIISSLNSLISKQIIEKGISVLDINTQLMSMSLFCDEELNKLFEKYGISIVDFSIMSITVPQDDESVIKLRQAKDLAARLNITGRDVYQMERSFDVLDKAASNEGVGGQMMAMGAGVGVGVGVGNAMGCMAGQMLNTNPVMPPPISEVTYHLYVDGKQIAEQTMQQVSTYIQQGIVTPETLVWTAGMTNWSKASEVPDIASVFNSQTPPPIPSLK